jgi:hypothetical protein
METKELKGKVVRWTTSNKWGIANFYVNQEPDPRKVFVHVSKVVSADQPKMGSHIIFDLGAPRHESELPQALRVRVITSSEAL